MSGDAHVRERRNVERRIRLARFSGVTLREKFCAPRSSHRGHMMAWKVVDDCSGVHFEMVKW